MLHDPALQNPDCGLWKAGSSSAFLGALFSELVVLNWALVTQATHLLSTSKTTKTPFVVFSHDV